MYECPVCGEEIAVDGDGMPGGYWEDHTVYCSKKCAKRECHGGGYK